jgi:hypothetical protein
MKEIVTITYYVQNKFSTTTVKQEQQKGPIKAGEIFKVRFLNDESMRWMYTQRKKLHINDTKENETDIEKEWKNLQNIKISSK